MNIRDYQKWYHAIQTSNVVWFYNDVYFILCLTSRFRTENLIQYSTLSWVSGEKCYLVDTSLNNGE